MKRPRRPDAITLTAIGLPALTWNRGARQWECATVLPAWSGFTLRYSTDDPPGAGAPSDGKVWLSFDAPDSSTPPSAAQVMAYLRLSQDDVGLKNAVLQAVFEEYGEFLNRERLAVRELGVALTDPAQLTRFVALNLVNIGAAGEAEQPSFELEFDCLWDTEHGFIVQSEGGRVTYVGPR